MPSSLLWPLTRSRKKRGEVLEKPESRLHLRRTQTTPILLQPRKSSPNLDQVKALTAIEKPEDSSQRRLQYYSQRSFDETNSLPQNKNEADSNAHGSGEFAVNEFSAAKKSRRKFKSLAQRFAPSRKSIRNHFSQSHEDLKDMNSKQMTKNGQNYSSSWHKNFNGLAPEHVITNGEVKKLPMFHEEESNHPASVESLVRKCAECFDENGKCINEEYPHIFFLTHPWFMTSEQLLVLFTQLYKEERLKEQLSKKIFFAIRFWLQVFPVMFDLDQALVSALEELRNHSINDPNVDTRIIDLSNKDSYKWRHETHLSVLPNQMRRKHRKVSLVFEHLNPEEIAIHISYLEYKCFRRITLHDFHNYAVHGVIKDNPRMERMVFLFNNITHWIQCMILTHHNPQERAVAIVKFIEIAKKLHEMQNFNTLMAVIGALTHTAISRMKKTMSAVPKDALNTLDEYVQLLDSKINYKSYRRAYGQTEKPFKIPVIGIIMKDLIALQAALPDRVGDGLINVRKMNLVGGIFRELTSLQKTNFPYDTNRDLVNTLRVSLYLYHSEEEIYKLSNDREPRERKPSNSGQTFLLPKTANMGFAEFARYTCQLDDDIIKQHVTAMVVSVFKAYDHNSDGFISETEFDNFILNFPGLDSFAIVDVNHDGRISKEEMIDYFLKINSARRNEFCQIFKHEFNETTYFHPIFCEECGKLLWGLVKQGWKCKDCGINCHKHCKDRIVQECRQKASIAPTPTNRSKKDKNSRPKSLNWSESDISTNDDCSMSSRSSLLDKKTPLNPERYVKRSQSLASADHHSTLTKFLSSNKRSSLSQEKIYLKSSTGERRFTSLQRKMQNIILKRRSTNSVNQNIGVLQANNFLKNKTKPTASSLIDCVFQNSEDHPDAIDSCPSSLFDQNKREEKLETPQPQPFANGKRKMRDSVPSSLFNNRHNGSDNSSFSHSMDFLNKKNYCSEPTESLSFDSSSAPVTPVAFDNALSNSFVYTCAAISTLEMNSQKDSSNSGDDHLLLDSRKTDSKYLLEENNRLRRENEELYRRLEDSHAHIYELEAQIRSNSSLH